MNARIHKLASTKSWLAFLGLALLVLGMLSHAEQAQARLNPFYIVQGTSYGKLNPRILFVVDSSATMRYEQPWPDVGCDWGECESWNPDQSRVHASRYVINQVTAAAADEAEFALMTFGQATPPRSVATVPEPCESADNSQSFRFVWVEESDAPGYMAKLQGKWQLVSQTSDIINPFGSRGAWVLCGDNRLFPYLRHDELGSFSLANNSVAPLPSVPVYATAGTEAGYFNAINATRRVQWFPRYIGRRGNLDCSDANQEAIAYGSYGDYANNNSDRDTEVCGHDYYYWPYVDGFAGYSWHTLTGPDDVWEQVCLDDGSCSPVLGSRHRGGVSRRDENIGAGLFAPFYSSAVLAANNIPAADKGPLSPDDQAMMFDGMTRKAWEGGVDVSGDKPFIEVIGDLDDYLSFGVGLPQPTGSMVNSNAPLTHDSVASYLAFISTVTEADVCRPMAVIFLTDAMPEGYSPSDNKAMYTNLRKFRTKLGVRTYVVGFSNEWWNNGVAWDGLNLLACSAAGSNNTSVPCGGQSAFDWDTCDDPTDQANACAYRVATADDLKEVLTEIIGEVIATDVPGGSPTVANDFQLADANDPDSQTSVQTSIASWTEIPEWYGHIAREACDDPDPLDPNVLAEHCQNAIDLPLETDELESYGPCPIGRVWDAGECLQQTDWTERRIYTHDFNNDVFRISDDSGDPTPEFVNLVTALDNQGKIDPPLSGNGGDKADEIEAMAQWLLGKDMPNDWKVPGLPNSAPVLIRRVPPYDANFLPTVGIRDPHCAGRRNGLGDNVPESLEEFSNDAWQLSSGNGFADHYDYAEAVLFGDDFGTLHAIHYDSGNEMFGFVPMALLSNSRKLSASGTTDRFGQPEELDEHVFGVASTINNGYAWDEDDQQWRHLAVFGLGPGGTEILTLDVSHMGRLQTDDPVEVMWTTSTAAIADDYADTLGETWSRPALTYAVPNDAMSLEPDAYVVFGSGYREGVGGPERGRTVWVVDALTGETVTQKAYMAPPNAGTTYDVEDDYAAIGDIAVGSHCLSRYWGEAQEAYWADPAGRLYRWDLVTDTSNTDDFLHTSDGGGSEWPFNQGFAQAQESFRFPACQGGGDFSCSVGSIAGGAKGDVFTFSPAVVSANRIDPPNDSGAVLPIGLRDQFLVALVSGSPNDNTIDFGADESDYHSSIYLLVDDHRQPDEHEGFTIPANAPLSAPGALAKYTRLALNQIERTRTVYFPDGTEEEQTRNFNRSARPIRAPMIRVTGLVDGDPNAVLGEVFYITFTIFEPGALSCDPRWFDEDSGQWLIDPGATFEVTFRLVVEDGETFDFTNNYIMPSDYGDGFGQNGRLSGPVVEEVGCEGGNCGATLRAPSNSPCDPNQNPPTISGAISIQTGWSELEGFSPLEVQL